MRRSKMYRPHDFKPLARTSPPEQLGMRRAPGPAPCPATPVRRWKASRISFLIPAASGLVGSP
jgi:hypothetical protein